MKITLVWTLSDADGDTATTSQRLSEDWAQDITNVEDLVAAVGALLKEIVIGSIRSCIALFAGDTSGLTSNTIGAVSSVNRQGKFEFLALGGNRVKVNIPALDESTGQGAGSDSLDLTDTQVAAFLSAMEDGIVIG